MGYIGREPGSGVRTRHYFTATGGETSLSGTDDNGAELRFSDGTFVDVSLNGVALVAGTDYNTTTPNTVAGLSALASGDIVEIIVYEAFAVADAVSANLGGTFRGAVSVANTLTLSGDFPIYQNAQSVNADYTISNNTNAMSAGPITIASGVTVTVGTGETWTVV